MLLPVGRVQSQKLLFKDYMASKLASKFDKPASQLQISDPYLQTGIIVKPALKQFFVLTRNVSRTSCACHASQLPPDDMSSFGTLSTSGHSWPLKGLRIQSLFFTRQVRGVGI